MRAGPAALAVFMASIPAANWLIGHAGTVCVPQGPCLIPVGFGLTAPSGVLMVGLALVLRDIVHKEMGAAWTVAAILAGAVLSGLFAPPALALASAAAFLASELADMAVYTPLYRRRLFTAVIASSIAGAIVDSALLLVIAFGSLDDLPGQVLGKAWMVIAALPVIWLLNRQHQPLATK